MGIEREGMAMMVQTCPDAVSTKGQKGITIARMHNPEGEEEEEGG